MSHSVIIEQVNGCCLCQIRYGKNNTIHFLKEEIQRLCNIPIEKQKLVINGFVYNDDELICEVSSFINKIVLIVSCDFTIEIKTFDNNYTMKVSPKMSIGELKQKMFNDYNIPINVQHYIYDGDVVHDDMVFEKLSKNNIKLFLVIQNISITKMSGFDNNFYLVGNGRPNEFRLKINNDMTIGTIKKAIAMKFLIDSEKLTLSIGDNFFEDDTKIGSTPYKSENKIIVRYKNV